MKGSDTPKTTEVPEKKHPAVEQQDKNIQTLEETLRGLRELRTKLMEAYDVLDGQGQMTANEIWQKVFREDDIEEFKTIGELDDAIAAKEKMLRQVRDYRNQILDRINGTVRFDISDRDSGKKLVDAIPNKELNPEPDGKSRQTRVTRWTDRGKPMKGRYL